ncbi:hypothetical protein EA187_11350 [Lujinxingia sediminis]|uniref:DUF4157 domain-containing protein n=1 Tax=Lujinxingia sediminis TaxID=2480984 RepID=A0ABY0CTK4_9DELT|nr:hypothetical protein [Lujinxingia sediminis]RVU44137.1 hypothetical protein EA187_11350 [Lujinxingia sediminis]
MSLRPLLDDERPVVIEALTNAGVGPRLLVERAAHIARIIAYPDDRPALYGPRDLIAHTALRRSAAGIALHDRIYIRQRIFSADLRLPLYLVTHEMAHVVQYLRDGSANFLARYFREYAAGLLAGLGDRQAYLNISYEVEARRAETFLPPHLHRSSSPRPT